MQWFQCYEVNFGKKLSQDEINDWTEEIGARIHNIQPGEALAAVRDLAEQIRAGKSPEGKYAPTCNHIIGRIIKLRAVARAERDGVSAPMAQTLDGAKSRLRYAKSLNAIYTVLDVADYGNGDFHSLIIFARQTFGAKFARPLLPKIGECHARMKGSNCDILTAHHALWNEMNAGIEANFQGKKIESAAVESLPF